MLLGIAIAVLGSIVGTLGKQLLRYAELRRQQTGSVSVLLSPILDVVALGFAPQSALAPLNGLGLVWNTLLAPFTLKERLSTSRIAACAIISSAMVVIALSGHSDTVTGADGDPLEAKVAWTVNKVESMLYRDVFAVYVLGLVGWIAGNMAFQRSREPGERLRGLSLGLLGGSLAGNMFFVKITVELVAESADSGTWLEIWTQPLPWICLIGLVGFATSNVSFLAQGLKEQEALFMVAVFTGAQVVFGFFSGVTVLDEPAHPAHVGAVALVLVGIALLIMGEGSTRNKAVGKAGTSPGHHRSASTGESMGMRLRPRQAPTTKI